MIVLDASALLAYLSRESGHEIVGKQFEDASISTVNLSEIAGRFILEKSFDPRKTQKARKNSKRYQVVYRHPKGE